MERHCSPCCVGSKYLDIGSFRLIHLLSDQRHLLQLYWGLAVGLHACIDGADVQAEMALGHTDISKHGDGEQDELIMMLCTVASLFQLQATHRYGHQ